MAFVTSETVRQKTCFDDKKVTIDAVRRSILLGDDRQLLDAMKRSKVKLGPFLLFTEQTSPQDMIEMVESGVYQQEFVKYKTKYEIGGANMKKVLEKLAGEHHRRGGRSFQEHVEHNDREPCGPISPVQTGVRKRVSIGPAYRVTTVV